MTDGRKLLLTLAETVIGSGLGTTIVAALFKRRFGAQLETHKALLQRSGRIHERQVDALLTIHSKLEHALFYLRRVISPGKFEGELKDDELLQRMSVEMADASEEFSRNKLLMSEDLVRRINECFDKMFSTGSDLKLTLDRNFQGETRIRVWGNAQQSAFKELPSILEAIRAEAAAVIHG